MAQSITDIVPHQASFIAGAGSANLTIGTWTAVLSPTSPPFAGTWVLSGADAARFRVDQATGVISVGASDVAIGTYHVRLTATQLATAPPFPVAITLTPSSTTISDTSVAGTILCTVAVTMSDGSAFTGTITSSDTTGFFAVSAPYIVLGRDLTAADIGSHSTDITATQGGVSMTARITL